MSQEKIIEFSIIIPAAEIGGYIWETCEKIKGLFCQNFEVLILPNHLNEEASKLEKKYGYRVIATGKVSPARKRDLAIKYAQGKYLAFIDDDAYPQENWLDLAREYLKLEEVAAVGGPQLTPDEDSFWQKVSGAMFTSILSGGAIIRYRPGEKVQEIDDWPTVNFFIKKEHFCALGGFNSNYWPGEDTKFCLDLIKKIKKKIIYVPHLLVYHHRRAGLKTHLKQTGSYGLHRGYFFRVFPETSRKLSTLYFMPSLLVIFLIFGFIGSFYSSLVFNLYFLGIATYFLAIAISTFISIKRTREWLISLALIPYLILFHLWYGARFIQGFLFTRKLKSKLGR